jgi:Uma2 family endonuclease
MEPLMTAEDLETLHLPDKTTELVRGQLVVREPPSTRHGWVQANLQYLVMECVRRTRAGVVFGQDTGFKIQSNPDTVRGPDLAFVSAERVTGIPDRGFAVLAPDLIAEVLSPEDRPGETLAKVAEFLQAGTRLVWVIDPVRKEVQVYRADGTMAIVGPDGSLDGETILPGFRCALSEVLA